MPRPAYKSIITQNFPLGVVKFHTGGKVRERHWRRAGEIPVPTVQSG